MTNKELILKEMFGTMDKYAGYDGICNKLIETGSCITTIHASDMFKRGGICNFVNQKPYDGGVDLIVLSIDKEYIYGSELFKGYKDSVVSRKKEELDKLLVEVEKLQSFITELQ